jgi:CMP/dCMP kinase
MAGARSIVLNGDLGSGKSTVSRLLAERLGIRRISVGDLYREMARRRGLTALQLNLHAELDDTIDSYVDQLQSDIAAGGEQLIVDSRLAWFFFTGALKVHLIAEPTVAAYRALARPGDGVESYASVEDARVRIAERSESERARFLSRYGADKTRLANYDLVCDSTSASPAEIADRIEAAYRFPRTGTTLYLDPRRLRAAQEGSSSSPDGPVRVSPVRHGFVVAQGQHRVDDAVRSGDTLIEAGPAEPPQTPVSAAGAPLDAAVRG